MGVTPLRNRSLLLAAAAAVAVAGFSLTAFGSQADTRGLAVAKASGYMKGYETLGWAPASQASSYALLRDGTQVATAGAGATTARFYLQPGVHEIAAVPLFAAATSTATTTIPPPTTTTAPTTTTSTEQPLWHGDVASDFGDGWEFGGTFDGTPTLSQRVASAPTLDGISAPPGAPDVLRVDVAPGDQYGGSSGWRTLGHAWTPGTNGLISAGQQTWFVWAQQMPAGYPGDANMFVAPLEVHQTKAPNVSVTGPAPINITTEAGGIYVRVTGGQDGGVRTDYVKQTFSIPTSGWQVFVMGDKHGTGTAGAFEFDHCSTGQPISTLVSKTGIATMYDQTSDYIEFGLYKNQTGTSTTRAYFSGVREYATRTGALGWAAQLCS